MRALLEYLWSSLTVLPGRFARALRRLGCGCLLTLLLILIAFIALLAALVAATSAAAHETNTTYALYLLLDESNSMSDKGGLGSDPLELRVDAARLLISYLGVDSGDAVARDAAHAAAIIHFGAQPRLSAPLTPLDDAGRRALLERLASPDMLGWTDPLAALTLAREDMARSAAGRRPSVLMLTDGKGEWDETANPTSLDAYLTALRAEGARLANDGVPLFIILLANEATDADPDIETVWKPLWREMAARSPSGHFYEVRTVADLMPLYHDIVAALTGHVVAPPVVAVDDPDAARYPIAVEAGLAHLTLVIALSSPDARAQVFLPDGRRLTPTLPGVRFAGGAGLGAEEVWAIETPPAGDWLVLLDGPGRVMVWKDVLTWPTPTPTQPASPTPSPTVVAPPTRPSPTAGPTATGTAVVLLPVATPPVTIASAAPQLIPPLTPAPGRQASLWLSGIGLGVGGVAVALAVWRRRAQRPLVAGVLRPLEPMSDSGLVIDLDALRRRRVLVGAPPADVVLETCRPGGQRFAIFPGRPTADGHEMMLSVLGAPHVLVNDRPVAGDHTLRDMDVISCGPAALRYENLRLRPAAWSAPQQDDFLTAR
jgi:hypothetical protein